MGSEVEALAEASRVFYPLRQPVLQAAVAALRLPSGSRGLDAGCGLGLPALMLAEAVGPRGHITGLDLSAEILQYAEELVQQAGFGERITFRPGDIRQLPFDDDRFDWAWSLDCVGYAPLEPLPLVNELARVVRPGGRIAILAWSSEQLLPGYPQLEARLEATAAGIAPFIEGKAPQQHFLRALGWFRKAGLEACTARTLAGGAHAPLTKDLHDALLALFQMRWPGVEAELDPQDRAEFERLCLPESPDFILDRPDYYAFFTYTMFQGGVPE